MVPSAASGDDHASGTTLALRSGLPVLVGLGLVLLLPSRGGDVWTLAAAGLGVPYLAAGVAVAALAHGDRESLAVAAFPAVATIAILVALLGGILGYPLSFATAVALAGAIVGLAFPLGYARRARVGRAIAGLVAVSAIGIVAITVDMVTVPRLDDPPVPLLAGAALVLLALVAGAPLYRLGDSTASGESQDGGRHVPGLAAAFVSLAAAAVGAGLFFALEPWLLFEGRGPLLGAAAALLVGLPLVLVAGALYRTVRTPAAG